MPITRSGFARTYGLLALLISGSRRFVGSFDIIPGLSGSVLRTMDGLVRGQVLSKVSLKLIGCQALSKVAAGATELCEAAPDRSREFGKALGSEDE